MARMYVNHIPAHQTVNLRRLPSLNGKILTRVNYGEEVDAVRYSDEWSEVTYREYNGYIMTRFLSVENPLGGGQAAKPTPIPLPMEQAPAPMGAATYQYRPEKAVAYALNHSDNSKGPCPLRNTVFRSSDGRNDCADFVSQCICAGGVPMFDGWFYRLPGIPAHWSHSKWQVTYSGSRRLLEKGWLTEIPYDAVRPGDIIYTFNPMSKPTGYTHVTIAVSETYTKNGRFGCNVCGYTQNQHNQFKQLNPAKCKCYRLKEIMQGDGREKRVELPLSGSGATVLPD